MGGRGAVTGAALRVRGKAGRLIAQHRRRSCDGKVRHGSCQSADEVRRRMEAQFGSPFAVYLCRYCNSYHVGNDKGG